MQSLYYKSIVDDFLRTDVAMQAEKTTLEEMFASLRTEDVKAESLIQCFAKLPGWFQNLRPDTVDNLSAAMMRALHQYLGSGETAVTEDGAFSVASADVRGQFIQEYELVSMKLHTLARAFAPKIQGLVEASKRARSLHVSSQMMDRELVLKEALDMVESEEVSREAAAALIGAFCTDIIDYGPLGSGLASNMHTTVCYISQHLAKWAGDDESADAHTLREKQGLLTCIKKIDELLGASHDSKARKTTIERLHPHLLLKQCLDEFPGTPKEYVAKRPNMSYPDVVHLQSVLSRCKEQSGEPECEDEDFSAAFTEMEEDFSSVRARGEAFIVEMAQTVKEALGKQLETDVLALRKLIGSRACGRSLWALKLEPAAEFPEVEQEAKKYLLKPPYPENVQVAIKSCQKDRVWWGSVLC